MTALWRLTTTPSPGTEAVVLPAFTDLPPERERVPDPAFLTGSGFDALVGQVLSLPGAPALVLLGVGPWREFDASVLRRAAAGLARAVRFRSLAVEVPGLLPAPVEVRCLVEGFRLGGYTFDRHRGVPAPAGPETVEIVGPDTPDTRAAAEVGTRLSEAVLLARDLVNEPGAELTPALFAARAKAVAAETGLTCEVWDVARLTAEGMGGLLAVGGGSPRPPCLVRLTHLPADPLGSIALVGKGVTFDAGGLSLKPNAQMADMKADMAGAAAVLAAMSTLSALGCPLRVDAWLPLAENMPNADPVRIGDVLRMADGTTVEVRNADAEGRLLLADALVLAGRTEPDGIVDIATLTDAAAVALGRGVGAVMGNHESWTDAVGHAAARAGEHVWPLPLPRMYRSQLRSRVADLVNYTLGTRHGTALLAGLFLAEFVPEGIPWAHLDIQGVAVSDADDGEWTAGGTGFGVRTLVELLMAQGLFAD